MKPFIIIIIISLLPLHGMAGNVVPDDYVWTTPSRNSSESMPCGGHDVGMNVWVENGDVLFYVSRSGMFDENNSLLKAGVSASICPLSRSVASISDRRFACQTVRCISKAATPRYAFGLMSILLQYMPPYALRTRPMPR